jgi:hypothetical protein
MSHQEKKKEEVKNPIHNNAVFTFPYVLAYANVIYSFLWL